MDNKTCEILEKKEFLFVFTTVFSGTKTTQLKKKSMKRRRKKQAAERTGIGFQMIKKMSQFENVTLQQQPISKNWSLFMHQELNERNVEEKGKNHIEKFYIFYNSFTMAHNNKAMKKKPAQK